MTNKADVKRRVVIGNAPFNQMQARCSLHDMTNLAWFQGKRCVLEFLLHVALAKETPDCSQISKQL